MNLEMGSAQIDHYKWTHCNAQRLLSHTQQNGLKKHYEDVIVGFISLIHQREMSRMGLITRACQCLTCLWLMYDPSADCHVCMGLGLRSCDCNTQHDTVCSLWQQLRHVGDLWVL